jgi:AcrR family transcriptional regulator
MSEATDAGQRVLSAARGLFAERGYSATTTRAIAERAGVNEVTIFRRFTNKAGILQAIADQLAEQSAGLAAGSQARPSTDEAADARARLTELARMEVNAAIENGGLTMRLAFEARSVPEVAEVLGAGSSENFEGLVGYLTSCQEVGELRAGLPAHLLAEAFFSLTSNLVMARMLMGGPPPQDARAADDLVGQLIDLFWSGASAHPTTHARRSSSHERPYTTR